MNNPTNIPTAPPDCLLQAPEGPVAPPYSADHSPYKVELFSPDVGYSGNALHCVIVEDVHLVQTRNQAKAKGKAQAVVSKLYARQLLYKAPNEGPGPSTDTSNLKGVNIAIPIDTMKAHHPKLCDSILKFLSMADDLDIYLVNKISSSYSECTYADIFVNKIKVQAIIDTGAPINIVSTCLVKRLGLAPDIDHQKQYGTAGLTVTTAQGASSALTLRFGSLALLALAIVLTNDNYDILIDTLFMRQYRVRTDLAADTFEILGQTIPLYYCYNKDTGTHKTMPSVNLAYKNRVVPIQYQKLSRKVRPLPNQLEEYKGLPLCVDLPIEILAGHQVLVETGLDLDIPQGLHGELQSPRNCSCLEPLVAPGLILPGHGAVKVLLENLTQGPIRVQRHQVVAYLNLILMEEVTGIHNFGTLEEFGLGSSDGQPPLVGAVIPREKLAGLSTEQQDAAMALFEKYKSIFAEDNFNLGCAKNTLHYINTGDKGPSNSALSDTHRQPTPLWVKRLRSW
ncbi:DNA damage-inducible protein 1 [Entomophthora muscae]|uniref:DNA damage-inducible protein 1 n=1 Tax=Entomophthora muscae TaxID=34485 RepID=A0ACC2SB31_9FUNG|nr:DNA damage-inducible protein 1 [Entomophthora muscae]